MAFLVLNLLGSCVHTSPSQHVSQPQVNPLAQQLSTEPAQITASNS
jgi:hypothetical protein